MSATWRGGRASPGGRARGETAGCGPRTPRTVVEPMAVRSSASARRAGRWYLLVRFEKVTSESSPIDWATTRLHGCREAFGRGDLGPPLPPAGRPRAPEGELAALEVHRRGRMRIVDDDVTTSVPGRVRLIGPRP